ncbi:hypothetical protein [Desertivirga xinjiangensis]|uniref:hypothetical protein n=1 Tax=Desertivirga xinjiangensis TaxID=539206 RepID=UPI00210895DE|nr:hypothetical protein [Pedobacter xinjiangensis]
MIHDPEQLEINGHLLNLQLTEVEGQYQSRIKIEVLKNSGIIHEKELLVHGTSFLYDLKDNQEGGTIAGFDDKLLISCGDSLMCYSVPDLDPVWIFQPDQFDLFEFYSIEDDFLIRGETSVYRVDKEGNKVWDFAGKDIFVNMEGKKEVNINGDHILLTDINGDEYKLSYQGELLSPTDYRFLT